MLMSLHTHKLTLTNPLGSHITAISHRSGKGTSCIPSEVRCGGEEGEQGKALKSRNEEEGGVADRGVDQEPFRAEISWEQKQDRDKGKPRKWRLTRVKADGAGAEDRVPPAPHEELSHYCFSGL